MTWKPPYRVDVSELVNSGRNVLPIKVSNLWINRMIGDDRPGARKYTWSTYRPFLKGGSATRDSPLQPLSLLDPVTFVKIVSSD